MLSVLIPTHNYDTVSLVTEIQKQCIASEIIFEIIVLDDGSTNTEIDKKNELINLIPHCRIEKNQVNLGRGQNINKLVQKSQYDWVLILDCDVFPTKEYFIKNYLNSLSNQKTEIIYGGIAYKIETPEKNKLLRWVYGKKREQISVQQRNKAPYKTTLTSNFLIRKKIFQEIKFDERITQYGYEDLVFIENLKIRKITINHIDNPVYHLNYETSKIFLEKTELALKNLCELEKREVIKNHSTKIQQSYSRLDSFKLTMLFYIAFRKTRKIIQLNLLSSKPNLFLFDLYKLGFFISQKLNL